MSYEDFNDAIQKAGEEIGAMLAISLHAADDELRTGMMPVNKRYPIAELIDVSGARRELVGEWGFLRSELALLD